MATRATKAGVLTVSLLAGAAYAQTTPPPPAGTQMPSTAPQVTTAFDARELLQTTLAPALRIVPSVELSERYSDNAARLPVGFAQSDWVTDLTLGLNLDYRAARLNAHLDYRLDRLMYHRVSALNDTQHLLNSRATLEAVEKWLFIDARANITQQNVSAFGDTSISGSPGSSANRIETTTYQLSPYIRGQLGGMARYMLRVNEARTRTDNTAFPETKSREWTGFVKSMPSASWLGWSVDGNSLAIDNQAVGNQEDSRIRGSVILEIVPQLFTSFSGGTETSDLDARQRRTLATYGAGIEWLPSPRTQFAATTQKRFFGYDYLVLLTHRSPLTEWRLSSTREVAFSTNEVAGSGAINVSSLLLDLLAASIPDPASRAEASRQKFEQTGIPETSGIQNGFLAARPFLNRRHQASVAILGLRNTITVDLGMREQRAFGDGVNGGGNGGGNGSTVAAPVEQIRQFNANAAWAYRLSPVSNLRLVLSHLRTRSLVFEDLFSTQRLGSLYFTSQIGPHTSFSVGVQRLHFISTAVTTGYQENAVVSTLSVRF